MTSADNMADAGEPQPLAPVDARAEIQALETDPASLAAILDRQHPRHAELAARRTQLYQWAHPEPGAPVPAARPAPPPLTPAEARAKIAAMEGDPEQRAILLDSGHPRHRALNDERTALYLAAHPDDAAPADPNPPPATPEDYQLGKLVIPDGATAEPTVLRSIDTAVRTWAHSAGLTQGALDGVLAQAAQANRQRPDPVKAMATLRAVHGDGADARLAAARRAVVKLNDPRLVAVLEETGLGDDAFVIEELAKAAERRGW